MPARYEDFRQQTDAEVLALLDALRPPSPEGTDGR
jgi:predicted phosphoribosyltransferase